MDAIHPIHNSCQSITTSHDGCTGRALWTYKTVLQPLFTLCLLEKKLACLWCRQGAWRLLSLSLGSCSWSARWSRWRSPCLARRSPPCGPRRCCSPPSGTWWWWWWWRRCWWSWWRKSSLRTKTCSSLQSWEPAAKQSSPGRTPCSASTGKASFKWKLWFIGLVWRE